MRLIASDTDPELARMLDGYDCPAILVTASYEILATNDSYRARFGEILSDGTAYCYQVSHGYNAPCDEAGEDCPLAAATASGRRERVLHIHQTPKGREHVDVEMLPIVDEVGDLKYFVELFKPLPVASAEISDQQMVGGTPQFNRMLEQIARVGRRDASVLLLGETGTGKEMVARAIHDSSARAEKPMVTLECSGLTESLFESELFGHVKGAFTGANYNRQGLIEAADGGTLFLDEVGDIPYGLQVKLLRLIETRTFRPVGSSKTRTADFRLISATHKNLARMVAEETFRRDLYYRINVFPVHVPSLVERREDIPLLARSLLKKLTPDDNFMLTESAIRRLKTHRYQGNVRELRNILERAVVLANTHVIDTAVLVQCFDAEPADDRSLDLKTMEIKYLQSLMKTHHGDRQEVARIAGISVRTLYRKLRNADGAASTSDFA